VFYVFYIIFTGISVNILPLKLLIYYNNYYANELSYILNKRLIKIFYIEIDYPFLKLKFG
jgi:hypothetical protein